MFLRNKRAGLWIGLLMLLLTDAFLAISRTLKCCGKGFNSLNTTNTYITRPPARMKRHVKEVLWVHQCQFKVSPQTSLYLLTWRYIHLTYTSHCDTPPIQRFNQGGVFKQSDLCSFTPHTQKVIQQLMSKVLPSPQHPPVGSESYFPPRWGRLLSTPCWADPSRVTKH